MKRIQPFCRAALLVVFLASCTSTAANFDSSAPTPITSASGTATNTPFLPEGYIPPTETPAPGTPNPTPVPQILWIDPTAPDYLRQFAGLTGIAQSADPAAANIRLGVDPSAAAQTLWVYALVAPFPTLTDNVTLADLQSAWAGTPAGPFTGLPLWMDESTLAAFTALWGVPGSGSVRVADGDTLFDSAWAEFPSWGIVPFEMLEPRWKVLSVDGVSPVHNDFDVTTYALKLTFGLQPAAFLLPVTNRDASKLTVVAMTGVTALTRATADRMEKYGILYPGEEVRTVLSAADVTHISNEIPFYDGCPIPEPWTTSMRFCSNPSYITLLEDVGTDVIELTGNHVLDYGAAPLLTTIDMYDERGWLYFGGGRDLADSLETAFITHNGNKLAFLGCNYAGPPGAWATESRPGSTPCDFVQMEVMLAQLRAEGFLPIVTLQYNEYYQPFPTDYEVEDFRELAGAGALIVSGSQAHVPAAMEVYNGSFVHYGLGNLFFDQMSARLSDGSLTYTTRNVFIDRHIFYDGRYLGTELLTYIIEDYARPRLTTEQERIDFLQYIFEAYGW